MDNDNSMISAWLAGYNAGSRFMHGDLASGVHEEYMKLKDSDDPFLRARFAGYAVATGVHVENA